jgi:hypothetical protein
VYTGTLATPYARLAQEPSAVMLDAARSSWDPAGSVEACTFKGSHDAAIGQQIEHAPEPLARGRAVVPTLADQLEARAIHCRPQKSQAAGTRSGFTR